MTDAVAADWKQRQFGGPADREPEPQRELGRVDDELDLHRAWSNASPADRCNRPVREVRSALPSARCLVSPCRWERERRFEWRRSCTRWVFDLDLGPVSDVCSGPSSIMWGRCYGTDPESVANAVGPVVDGIHAANLLAAAKHFPGHGNTA